MIPCVQRLISASDDVGLTKYSFSVDAVATQATLTSGAIGFSPADLVEKEAAGKIQINGESIEIKEGDSYEDVYAQIRDYCEMMNIDVIPVNGAGEECELGLASNLSFVSKLYGSSQKIEVTTDNRELANKLGVNGATGQQGKDAEVTLDTPRRVQHDIRCVRGRGWFQCRRHDAGCRICGNPDWCK